MEQGYDRIAEAYTIARVEMREANREYLALLVDRLPVGANVLDLGCGSGIPVTEFLSRRYDVTGVDISHRQVERARDLVPRATFLKQDMTRASFPDETFDAIVSFYAIIHVPRAEHRELFQRIHRMLKRRGLLLVTLASDAWEGIEEHGDFGVEMYWSHFGPAEYRSMLSNVGFEILRSAIQSEEFQGETEENLYLLAEKV